MRSVCYEMQITRFILYRYKYLTEEDNIDVFVGGLLHEISCMNGTHS